mgnify:CR=1 FL=1
MTLTQKALSIDKDTILSLEAKVRELEGKSSDPKEIDSLRLELERVKEDESNDINFITIWTLIQKNIQ